MYIAYIDESGDPGHNTRITRYFTLSGIIVADSNWKVFLDRVKVFRKGLKKDFGLTVKADLRATDLWHNSGDFRKLNLIMQIGPEFLEEQPSSCAIRRKYLF